MTDNDPYVVDKTYTFGIGTNGGMDKTTFHIQLTPTMVMRYGEYFLTHELENNEVPISFGIKAQLDEKEAECIAQNLYEQYCEENDIDDKDDDEDDENEDEDDEYDDDCDGEVEVEDFYDAAYEYIGDNYYYYTWPEDFKKDCIDYYKRHK